VPSAVRDEAEVNAMLAVSTIKGGIRVGAQKQTPNTAVAASAESDSNREPALSR
ncbi:MAG: geranylgeranyl reductase, partial [Cyanobacteria bacterium M_surface_7_m2_040]|nr:geranylgeranyl reductase [Cyanobacteria bacterium M_surface_7_m2_040]